MNTKKRLRSLFTVAAVPLLVITASPDELHGQGRGNRTGVVASSTASGIELGIEARTRIRDFYASHPVADAEALPPGIRRNLSRGKPLPPGIAKKSAPADLRSSLGVAEGYEIVEVGLDVFLVEVATQVIHDVLMDVVR